MLITPSDIRRPYRSACGSKTNLDNYQLSFWRKPMLITLPDIQKLKYNNLSNLTGMIWHIDPAIKTLETWFENYSLQAFNDLSIEKLIDSNVQWSKNLAIDRFWNLSFQKPTNSESLPLES